MSDLRQRTNGKANGNGTTNGNGQPKVVVTEEGKKLDQRLDKHERYDRVYSRARRGLTGAQL